jgi:hypothetical protein
MIGTKAKFLKDFKYFKKGTIIKFNTLPYVNSKGISTVRVIYEDSENNFRFIPVPTDVLSIIKTS